MVSRPPFFRFFSLALLLVWMSSLLSCGDDATPAGPGDSSLPIFINEFMASNRSGITDPDFGERGDWIELYNEGDDDVDLGGFFMTDNLGEREFWKLPAGTIVEAGAYLIVWADGRNFNGLALHAPFALNILGEEIGLFDANGASIDQLAFGEQEADISTGRTSDGAMALGTFVRPTPGAGNTSLPPNLPPAIVAVSISPLFPLAADTVLVTAVVVDDSMVAEVKLHYNTSDAFLEIVMNETAPDTFAARIPPLAAGTSVSYYIEAVDNADSVALSPAGAPDTVLAYTVSEVVTAVWINEFLASNDLVNSDPDFGEYGDWLEIYNGGALAVDLGGWTLTDDLANPDNWSFPEGTSLDAGSFLLIWTDGKDSTAAALHADFKLSANGEQVGLFTPSGAPVDTLSYDVQETDISYGRTPDGGGTWITYTAPTPGASNVLPRSAADGAAALSLRR